jgi:ribosomal protein S18 acetylase RimI-like enzyme
MVLIRDATLQDARFLAENNVLMAEETEDWLLDPGTVAKGVDRLLTDPSRGRYLIAQSGDVPVGQCLLTYEWSDWRCGDFWWIQSVYVLPQFRRKGVFTAMYRHIMQLAENSEFVAGVRLYVERENNPAQQTYRSLGMSPAPYTMYERDFTRIAGG